MGVTVGNTGSGTFGEVKTVSVAEDATADNPAKGAGSVGTVTITAVATTDSELLSGNIITLSGDGMGTITSTVDTVNISGRESTVSFTAPTALQGLNTERSLHGIESGCAPAALHAALLITAGPWPSSAGRFWPLRGHTVGIDLATGVRLVPGDNGVWATHTDGSGEIVKRPNYSNTMTFYGNDNTPTNTFGPFEPYTTGPYASNKMFRTTQILYADSFHPEPVASASTDTMQVEFVKGVGETSGGIVGDFNIWFEHGELGGAPSYYGLTWNVFYDHSANTLNISRGLSNTQPMVVQASTSTAGIANLTHCRLRLRYWHDKWGDAKLTVTLSDTVGGTPITLTHTAGAADGIATSYDNTDKLRVGPGAFNLWRGTSGTDTTQNIDGTGWGFNIDMPALEYVTYDRTVFPDASVKSGSEILGFTGNMWDYVNQVCSGRGVEVAVVDNTITMRDVGSNTINLTDDTNGYISIGRDISVTSTGRKIVVVNGNTTYQPYSADGVVLTYNGAQSGEILDSETTYTVAENQKVTVAVELVATPAAVYQPRPVTIGSTYVEPSLGTGYYIVSGQDNLPVPAAEWLDYGGSVTIRTVADAKKLEIDIVGPNRTIPGVPGPYSLSVSDGSTTYPALHIGGDGVIGSPQNVTLWTGAPVAQTTTDVANTITNVAITSLTYVHDRGMIAAGAAAGPNVTVNATIPTNLAPTFGLVAGSVFRWRGNVYRIVQSTIGRGTISFTAVGRAPMSAFNTEWGTVTMGAFNTGVGTISMGDFSVRPLWRL